MNNETIYSIVNDSGTSELDNEKKEPGTDQEVEVSSYDAIIQRVNSGEVSAQLVEDIDEAIKSLEEEVEDAGKDLARHFIENLRTKKIGIAETEKTTEEEISEISKKLIPIFEKFGLPEEKLDDSITKVRETLESEHYWNLDNVAIRRTIETAIEINISATDEELDELKEILDEIGNKELETWKKVRALERDADDADTKHREERDAIVLELKNEISQLKELSVTLKNKLEITDELEQEDEAEQQQEE